MRLASFILESLQLYFSLQRRFDSSSPCVMTYHPSFINTRLRRTKDKETSGLVSKWLKKKMIVYLPISFAPFRRWQTGLKRDAKRCRFVTFYTYYIPLCLAFIGFFFRLSLHSEMGHTCFSGTGGKGEIERGEADERLVLHSGGTTGRMGGLHCAQERTRRVLESVALLLAKLLLYFAFSFSILVKKKTAMA